jgi:DNA repair protein RecO (recombination protein O)
MRSLATDALVLHAFDYRETSRIVRLVTREAGVVSVVARGAKRPKNRFGAALDLFASGAAQIIVNSSRDLHTLQAFEAVHTRPDLATSLDRFAAANALAELCLRFGRESETGALYDEAVTALDDVARASQPEVTSVGLAGAWRLVGEFGFAPTLEDCALCHAAIPDDADVTFHHRAGGALCASCARQARGGRKLPAAARAVLRAWARGEPVVIAEADARSHLRLLREFLEEHLSDGKALRAFAQWESRHGGVRKERSA